MHSIEKMSPALSTRMNSFNFILNERGGVLTRRVQSTEIEGAIFEESVRFSTRLEFSRQFHRLI